jgi:hypothetical protein
MAIIRSRSVLDNAKIDILVCDVHLEFRRVERVGLSETKKPCTSLASGELCAQTKDMSYNSLLNVSCPVPYVRLDQGLAVTTLPRSHMLPPLFKEFCRFYLPYCTAELLSSRIEL